MIRTALSLAALVLIAACSPGAQGGVNGPPLPDPGLPSFANAPAIYGTPDDPDKFGPARARIEGNSFYLVADSESDKFQNDWDKNIFSRRIAYDPTARTLRSDHRDLALEYDETKGAFVGTIQHPQTRKRRNVEVTVPETELPK